MSEEAVPEDPSRPFYKSPFFWGFIFGAVALVAIRPLQDAMLSAPPPLVHLEPWSLTDQDGEAFGSEQLQGKVWVADFFFTRCPSICVRLTEAMAKVQKNFEDLGDDVHLVSVSVDPAYDRPEVLTAYAKKHGAKADRWTFLTGAREDIVHLGLEQMKLFLGEAPPPPDSVDPFDISHTGKLVLVDQNGDVRAYFDIDPQSLGALSKAARLLVRKGPNP